MEMKTFAGAAILLLSILTLTSSAHADLEESIGRVSVGIEYRNSAIEMQTRFIRRTSGVITENANFENPYSCSVGSLFVGYTLPYKRLYLSARIFFNLFNDEFGLSAGSSRFTNKINHAFGIALIPGIDIFQGLSVFGKFSTEQGDFDFVKASPTSTTYDVNTNLVGTTLGFGIAYDITPRFRASIGFDQTRYGEAEIDTSLGVLNDKTLVKPKSESFFLSLQYSF